MPQSPSDETVALAQKLFDAARSGDHRLLRAYLEAGAPVAMRNHAGDTLLTLAAYHEHPDTVAMLLELGAEVEAANDRGQRALTCATFKQDTASMRLLLDAGADPDAGTPSARDTARMFGGEHLLAMLDGAQKSGEQGSGPHGSGDQVS